MESFMIRMEDDSVVIYISSIKAMKRLPNNYNICVNQEIVNNLTNFLGENNVKVVEKIIEKERKDIKIV